MFIKNKFLAFGLTEAISYFYLDESNIKELI